MIRPQSGRVCPPAARAKTLTVWHARAVTSETRTFNGLSGSFTLSYAYNQSSQLTEITNPWNAKVGYTYNFAGELTGVTGQGYAGVTSYSSGTVYRAFGGLRQMSYANGRSLSLSYNNRMLLTQYSIPNVMSWNYCLSPLRREHGTGGLRAEPERSDLGSEL